MLTQADGCVIQGLTRCWENELQIDIKEMKNVVENIRKNKNTRVREMRRKILHKWYHTPVHLAHFQKNVKGTCWHGCQDRGVFMHMLWECVVVQKFWKEVQEEIKKMLNISWTITKEMAVLVKRSILGEFSEIKEAAIESSQAVIVLEGCN
uniref:Reverse transcriptase zinc-binding domain-containing protein n=2 Tax=Micrurus spixii TaxID=129469 RepID=A0A2D4LUS4_9SAUR